MSQEASSKRTNTDNSDNSKNNNNVTSKNTNSQVKEAVHSIES
jgi:hypothetical protein